MAIRCRIQCLTTTLYSNARYKKAEIQLVDSDIHFIPNTDFQSATEDDFDAIDIDLYSDEDERPESADPRLVAETFLNAVDRSRLLTFEGEQFLFKRLNFLRFRANAIQATLPDRRPPRKKLREIARLLDEAAQTREEIAQANLRLVISIARKHSSGPDECDEFVSESNAILLNAIDKFDFARGYRFSTYATHAIQRHLFRVIGRQNKRAQRETTESSAPLSAISRDVPTDEPTQADILAAATSIVSRMDEVLTNRESTIVIRRFGLDESGTSRTLREIAEEIGISKERVRQILLQSVEKLAGIAEPFESIFAVDDSFGEQR
jgi:RNA polymerase primary sigma factor